MTMNRTRGRLLRRPFDRRDLKKRVLAKMAAALIVLALGLVVAAAANNWFAYIPLAAK